MIITIDGPAGVGKTTLANNLSKELSFTPVSSGNLYRAIAFNVVRRGVSCNNKRAIRLILKTSDIKMQGELVFLNGEDISQYLHSQIIDETVPYVANHKFVRKFVNSIVKNIAKQKNVVLDGRDMGEVFSNADVKFILIASAEERANRRFMADSSESRTMSSIFGNIKMRDGIVKNRKKIRRHKHIKNAITLDTTNMTTEEVLKIAMLKVNEMRNIITDAKP